ncbi:hypothetical protein ACOSQ3_029290 [Xanthoceras sorbifolium]
MILQNFLPEEAAHILAIPSLAADSLDILNWSLDRFGIYSAKNGYWFDRELELERAGVVSCYDLAHLVSRNKWVHTNMKLLVDGVISWAKAFLAELEAIGIQLAVDVDVFPILVESDSKVVVDLINGHGVN